MPSASLRTTSDGIALIVEVTGARSPHRGNRVRIGVSKQGRAVSCRAAETDTSEPRPAVSIGPHLLRRPVVELAAANRLAPIAVTMAPFERFGTRALYRSAQRLSGKRGPGQPQPARHPIDLSQQRRV